MEWKIGEIRQIDGEWYQCVESHFSCEGCDFKNTPKCSYEGIECSYPIRQDHTSVIFKKLEKVGEPCEFQKRMIQTYKLYTEPFISFDMDFINTYLNGSDTIDIIIKQNIEDMEEKYSELTDIVHEYMDKDMAYKDFKEAIDDWVNDYNKLNKETDKLALKPFDIEAAKAGKPVCTMDGRKARIVCFDRNDLYPIVALIECEDGKEMIGAYSKEGHTEIYEIKGTDLMMLPEKKEGWVKIRKDVNLYNTKEEADRKMIGNDEYVTAKVFWEE